MSTLASEMSFRLGKLHCSVMQRAFLLGKSGKRSKREGGGS